MFSSYVVFALVLIATATAAGALAWTLRRRSQVPLAGSWDTDFDIGRYRPMHRLLSEDDILFLARVGADSRTTRRMRSERRLLFARYLSNLEMDFARLHGAARELLLAAPEDRPDLAAAIMKQQLEFQRCVWTIRLSLHVPGFSVASEHLGRLLDAAQGMRATAGALQAGTVLNAA